MEATDVVAPPIMTPEYVDPAVERLRDSTGNGPVTLLLGVSEPGSTETAVERTGATVEDTLGRATLRVTASEATVDDLCSVEGVTSIELERSDVRTLEEGNAESRRRVTR